MTRRRLDRSRSRIAERIAPTEYHVVRKAALLNIVEAGLRERDAAHQDGYMIGWLEGYEQGLRERLDDAKAAMGEAA